MKASNSVLVGAVAGPRRVTEMAAAALARVAAEIGSKPAARAAIRTPVWASPAPVEWCARTEGAPT